MSRTVRKKQYDNKPPVVAPESAWWKNPADPKQIAQREEWLSELESRGCDKTRVRRGKVVAIPARWQGQVTGDDKKAKRRAKARNKAKDRKRKLRKKAKIDIKFGLEE